MTEKPKQRDTTIAVIVIIAGLLTGAIITHHFVSDGPAERSLPDYPMAEDQRIPYEMLVAEREGGADGEIGEPAAAEAEVETPDDGAVSDTIDHREPRDDDAPRPEREHRTAAERKAIYEARKRMEAEGVEEFVALDDELYVSLSASMVVMAGTLEHHPEASDPVAMQGLLGDYAVGLLADARVDPDDFYEYTRRIHSDRERAMEIGEQIIREAEKHTDRRIDASAVPGVPALPVPEADGE